MELAERIAAYATRRMPRASAVQVTGLQRIFGGASRETYRFGSAGAKARGSGRGARSCAAIPPGSLIETDRAVEFGAYRAFHGTAVPVPEPLWLEEDPRSSTTPSS